MTVPILSFFTGGGLFDIGFEQAGFESVWTNEPDPLIARMYEHGVASWRGLRGESLISCRDRIEDLSPRRVQRMAFGDRRPPLFGMIGGPPCTDFSAGGLNNGHCGQHGRLTRTFIEMILGIGPHFLVIENVPGLLRTKKHRTVFLRLLSRLRTHGHYAVDFRILNSLELGVPQDRERLFVVGIKRRLLRPTIRESIAADKCSWFTWPEDPQYYGARALPWPAQQPFGGRAPRRPKGIPLELTVYPLLSRDNDPEALPNGTECFQPYSWKFHERAEGDVSNKSFKRLHRYRYSPTAWYGNNEVHLHPWKARRLSVREALRIQTVPDAYVLPSDLPLSRKFKMICNGVPCLMARKLGGSLMRFLRTQLVRS